MKVSLAVDNERATSLAHDFLLNDAGWKPVAKAQHFALVVGGRLHAAPIDPRVASSRGIPSVINLYDGDPSVIIIALVMSLTVVRSGARKAWTIDQHVG